MISGMAARRVNKPSIINAAQKNSAKTINANEVVEPIWKGSEKREALSEKCTSLSKPWFTNIREPAPKRNSSVAIVKAESEVFVLNIFFIYIDLAAMLQNNFLFEETKCLRYIRNFYLDKS